MIRRFATARKCARWLLAGTVVALMAACGSEPVSTGGASLPALATFTVEPDVGGASRAWDGVVEAVQQAELAAQTAGRVTRVNVDINDRVAAGDVLLRLTAVEQEAGANSARAQLRVAEAAVAEATANYRRHELLARDQFVSRAQVDLVRAARDTAVAARDAARAQLSQAAQQTEYTVVRAPFAGVVSARRVEPGESVAPGQFLLAIHAPGALRIQVQVPQSDAAAIRAAGSAKVLLADGRKLDAAEVAVYPAADPATHSVGVRVTLPELDDAPTPGVTAKVVFPVARSEGRTPVRIPLTAIAQRGELSGVYVVAGERIVLRQLRLGRRGCDSVEVLAGLKQGDEVVSDPTMALQALAAQRANDGDSRD